MPVQPFEKGLHYMSLQTRSTHILHRHVLTGKFTCLCMAFIPCCYWLLKFCSCGCGKTNKYKYIQTYMQTYTLFVKQFQQTRHAHSRPKHVPGLKIKNSMNRNEAIRYHQKLGTKASYSCNAYKLLFICKYILENQKLRRNTMAPIWFCFIKTAPP